MTNLHINKIKKNTQSKSKKKGPQKEAVLLSIVFLIILYIGAHSLGFFKYGPAEEVKSCGKIETDALNAIAALGSYLADPANGEVPTFEDLVTHENLSISKYSTVIIDGPLDRIRITVIDKKRKCIRGNKYMVYRDRGEWRGEWYAK